MISSPFNFVTHKNRPNRWRILEMLQSGYTSVNTLRILVSGVIK